MTPLSLEADLRAGDHVCAMYDTDAEWLRAAIPYFGEGLVRGEACVYVAPEKNAAQLEVALRAAGIDVTAALRRGALRFPSAEATYLRGGHFDPDAMIALWQELIDAAEGNGYTNLRVAGCPTWVNEGIPGAERWAEYEAAVNEFFRGRRAIKLCQYDRRLFSPTLLLDVLGCHPFAVVRGAVHANPFAGMPSASADRDLTDALARERTARLAAEAACRKKDEFIAVFSHELRTPLSSAVLAASLIERLPASDARVATARDVLRRQLDQSRRLVDELLDMERIATGQVALTSSRVDLAQLARECVAVLPVRDHELHVDARPAWVIGDLSRLEQIVGHLLAHVAKHTPAGGRITLSVFEDADDVVLRVDGHAATSRAGARGLGLSLASRLVELHGGRVQDSGDGPGHVVRLPAAPRA
jgi:signal transduction histidine kinase